MRRIGLACLLMAGVGFGCGDDEPSHSGRDAGDAASGGVGGAGVGGDGRSGVGGSGATGGVSGGRGGGSGSGGGGRNGGGAGSGGAGSGGTKFGMIKLVPNVVAGRQDAATSSSNIGSQQSALRVGTPSATTLLSLKYYVTNIQLCEEATLQGSGFSSIAGCISLYQNMPAGSPDYAEYTVMEAKDDDTPGRYVDLMTADGQAALRKPVMVQVPIATEPIDAPNLDDADGGVADPPARQAGVYRFGLINFYRPIKVKAEFPIIGETSDNYFRTKAVTAIHETISSGDGLSMDRVEIGDTLNGATEETTYMLNNGGALFVFQKPFAITQADIDAKAEINIDLVFNPDSFGQAYETNCAADIRVVVCDPLNNVAIDMPFVRMSPVPRKTGEQTRKEIYLVDYDANSKLRIELYYNGSDGEKGIQGVDTSIVYGSTTPTGNTPSFNTVSSHFVSQTGTMAGNDASVSLHDYRREVNLEGLRRWQNGTVTIRCLFAGSVCSTLNETITRAYTYEGEVVVSGG